MPRLSRASMPTCHCSGRGGGCCIRSGSTGGCPSHINSPFFKQVQGRNSSSVKIRTAHRGYLATATLQCMQTLLLGVQSQILARRIRREPGSSRDSFSSNARKSSIR